MLSFFGLTGFYYKHISNYATKTASLTNLLKGKGNKVKIDWNETCDQSFNSLEYELIKSPVQYSPDFKQQFIVQIDTSSIGAVVVLAQKFENNEKPPILYLRKNF